MEKETKKSVATKAEKKDATRNLIKEILMKKEYKHNDLIEEAAKLYVERFDNETDNINDVKGRVGSVLDIMKKEQDVNFEGGMYALNVKTAKIPPEVKKEKTARKTKKTEEKAESVETMAEKKEKPKATKAKKEKASPLPPAPLQPIAPVVPTTPEAEPTPVKETKPKKQTKRAKKQDEAEVKKEETVIEKETSQTLEEKVVMEALEEVKQTSEEKAEVLQEKTEEIVLEQKAENKSQKQETATVMDMSFLFGSPKPTKAEAKSEVKLEAKEEPKKEAVPQEKAETKKEETKEQPKKQVKAEQPQKPVKVEQPQKRKAEKPVVKSKTADEKLCEAFLKKIRSLGGDYFEYYSVYLLEKYSRKNGRRLESLRITAGDHDGGIDGEIELTDRLGFRETIYIQSKNWNPEKGDEKLWVVGETLLQQFIGACACRQAKDGKQNCRGIFITTSRFTPEAKRILEDMSDKIVGYDGEDLYEAAKESEFGIVKKNGEWTLDERLLSGEKAFFNML